MSGAQLTALQSTSRPAISSPQRVDRFSRIIARPSESAIGVTREPAQAGGLLRASVQTGARFRVALMLTSAVLLILGGHQVACRSVANPLAQAINSKLEPPTHKSPTAPRNGPEMVAANNDQIGAVARAQNGSSARQTMDELESAHVPFAHSNLRARNQSHPTDNQPKPEAQNVYETPLNETDAAAEMENLAEGNFEDNLLTRDILSEYLFITFRDRDMFHTNSGDQPTGNDSAAGGEPAAGDRDLLGLGVDTAQLASESALWAGRGAVASGVAANATISYPSHLSPIGDVELNPNALWVSSRDRLYWGDFFSTLNAAYMPFHSIICLVICIIGIFSNVTNIIVLTRPNMITAVNTILCAIACSDLIVNLSNIPYLSHLLSDNSDPAAFFTYGWALYTLMHAHVSVTAHTISIWLTCVLATWRYFVIRSRTISQRNWSVRLALRVILGVIVCVPILCIPSYLSFAILMDPPAANLAIGTTYRVGFSHLAEQSKVIRTFHFWMFSALTKLLPCVMLAFFTTVLVKKLLQARDRRVRLAQSNDNGTNNNFGSQMARNSPGDTNLTSLDSQQARVSVPNGRQPGSPVLERQRSFKGERSHVHVIGQLAGSGEPVQANGVAKSGAESESGAASLQQRAGHTSDKLQQLARKESLRNVSMVSRRQEWRDGARQAAISLDQDGQSGRPNAATCQVAPHSGSSCATDAECLQGSSCNVSSNGSINISLERLHREPSGAPESRTAQVFGHLLVESPLCPSSHASKATAQARTTLIAPVSPSSRAGSPAHELKFERVQALERPPNSLAPVQTESHEPETRSASTCGALELYTQLDAHDGNETSLRLGSMTPASLITRSQRHLSQPLARANLAVSAQEFKVQGSEANKLARGSMSHSNLRPDENGPDGRVRSIGSATFTPFQIVKLQATQRQLSQNETTTRLLIGVMIIFLICEFPAGILSALCAIFGQSFFDNVYQPMGIFTDLFALINSSVNFILYCFMSTQFRITFYRVVLRCPAPSAPKSINK